MQIWTPQGKKKVSVNMQTFFLFFLLLLQSKLYQEADKQNPAYINNFVEINGPSGWGILCFNTAFDFDSGNTICRESNDMFMYRTRNGVAGGYSGAFYKGAVTCNRNAMRASECNLRLVATGSCPEGHLVVDCTAGNLKT